MIRINLLGQARPKATKSTVPLEHGVQAILIIVALVVSVLYLGITYYSQKRELDATNAKISALRAEKASLEQVKQDMERFESQKTVLQQRIDVIETLQKNRTGGQDLLTMVANTVVHVDELWLTSLTRTGNAINVEGESGSINGVANFITQLKRSGYFDNVEIQETRENDLKPGVETYSFKMTASVNPNGIPVAPPQGAQPAGQPSGQPAAAATKAASTPQPVAATPAKGRS
jgi:Tfp pilus assembly protein PilN